MLNNKEKYTIGVMEDIGEGYKVDFTFLKKAHRITISYADMKNENWKNIISHICKNILEQKKNRNPADNFDEYINKKFDV